MTVTDQPDDTVNALGRVLAPLGRVGAAERLAGGTFATTYLVRMDGPGPSEVIVKVAPSDDRTLTYEQDLVRSEALAYRLLGDVPGVPVPTVLLEDWTRSACPTDVLAVTRLPGTLWWQVGLEPGSARDDRTRRELGAIMARIHGVTGTTFGYVNEESPLRAATWPEAFTTMVEAALADAARWHVEVPRDEIRAALARHGDALAEVTVPRLVHTDLWPGNVFIDPATGEVLGIIDAERALWGDPLIEVVGTDQDGRRPVPPALLEGYASVAEPLVVDSGSARVRIELYRLYFTLFQSVEVWPRAFSGDWVAGHVRTLEVNLRAALDALG